MTRLQSRESTRRFTGRHMSIAMIAFFGVIIAVNLTMAWFASRSWTGLVVSSGYVASQDFNMKLAAAREQKARGWRHSVTYAENRFDLELLDRDGLPVTLDMASVKIGRPASEFADQAAALLYMGGGLYSAEISLDPGIWQFTIDGARNLEALRLEARMFVRGDGRGVME